VRWYENIKRVERLLSILAFAPLFLFQASSLLDIASDTGLNDVGITCRGCLNDIKLLPNGDGWASVDSSISSDYGSRILHRRNKTWQWETLPSGVYYITSITADAPDDAWALTSDFHENANDLFTTGLLHFHQGIWQRVPFTSSDQILSFTMLTPNDGWAIDEREVGQGYVTTFMHFDGQTWQFVATPGAEGFGALAFSSPHEGWAVGSRGHIAHYLDGQWHEMTSPTSANLYSVQMLSPVSGWAIGESGETLYYDGTVWREPNHFTLPNATLRTVSMVSDHEGWATGGDTYAEKHRLWHFDGGIWHSIDFPQDTILQAVTFQQCDEGWAVGQDLRTREQWSTIKSTQGVIAHFSNGAWNVTTTPRLADSFPIALSRGISICILVAAAVFAVWLVLISFRQPRTSLLRRWWARLIGICALSAIASTMLRVAEPSVSATYHDELRFVTLLVASSMILLSFVGTFGMLYWEWKEKHKPDPVDPADLVVQPARSLLDKPADDPYTLG
jgi:hypothetical protein